MTSDSGIPTRRLVLAALAVLVVQVTVVSQVPPFAGTADIVPLAAMSAGLLLGSLPGAVFGFAIGLGLDLLVGQPLGQYALLDLAVGYLSGRLMELRAPAGRLFLLPLGAAATATATLGYGLLQVLFGGGAELSVAVAQQAVVAIAWGAVLAVPMNAVMSAMVGQGRGTGRRTGRTRAYATGGLSPLTPGKRK